MNKIIAGVSAAAMAAGLGLGAATLANAETTAPSPSPSTSATESTQPSRQAQGWGMAGRGRLGGEHRSGMPGMDVSALAEKLGVDESDLTEAMATARDAARPAEPATMPDTQEERDALRAEHQAAFAKALAEELGLEEASVTEALTELREERQAVQAAEDKEVLDKAVTDGELTQSEADAVQKAIDAGIVGVHGHGGPRR
ncbi:hypothetical protein [Tessaracoccus sp. ZS01]|uniref:hypothetical protein n=1 Tax=Tessaracoccus sp. ZS01 TaxID=1906324 RepID=UPI00096C4FD8|nr:hypothetical protein [Tessaracoccus sp. ZS01]MCG6566690.1 hypothetical protein [Tessaracoccus sp. ZS01]OMG59107.1 hypothetical protein BJN44_03490 [Tessaracoccus sp. ZS01]